MLFGTMIYAKDVMNKWEFAIIDRIMLGPLVGFSYIPDNDYTEFNIYLLFIVLHFKFY